MALHPHQSVLALPQFDLFALPPLQKYVLRDVWTEHSPITALSNSTTSIQFQIHTAENEFILLGKSELWVKFRIDLRKLSNKAEDKLTKDDWTKIWPINYQLNTMWKSVSVEIGNIPVTSSSLDYPYMAYLDALTHMRTAGWTDDDDDNMNAPHEIRSGYLAPLNKDFTQSREVELYGRLHLDLADQHKALLGGLDLKISLLPHDPDFYLMYDPAIYRATVRFTDIKFELHRALVSDSLVRGIADTLPRATAKYPITRKEVRKFLVPQNRIDHHETNLVKNERIPRKAFLAFVNNDAANGSPRLNPFEFKHYNLRNVRFVINSTDFPPRGFECNFETKQVNKAYFNFFEAMGQIEHPRCSITREEWMSGFTIFGFNISPDLSNSIVRNGYTSDIKAGDMSLMLFFSKALPENTTVIVFFEYDNLIEIPETRIPFKDFL